MGGVYCPPYASKMNCRGVHFGTMASRWLGGEEQIEIGIEGKSEGRDVGGHGVKIVHQPRK